MMAQDTRGFFLIIEGLDGTGKTTAARRLAGLLREAGVETRLTFEPHDLSAAGLFIRQILGKRITLKSPAETTHQERKPVASPRTLALAFALNRLDHNARVINPFLEGGQNRMVISDRYTLSSLVYQSSDEQPMETIMDFNAEARRPDLTIFLRAKPATCYARMKHRAGEQELFETRLGDTLTKYLKAIAFIEGEGDTVAIVEADGTPDETLAAMLGAIRDHAPDWLTLPDALPIDHPPLPTLPAMDVLLDAERRTEAGDSSTLEDLSLRFLVWLERQGYQIGEGVETGIEGLLSLAVSVEVPPGIRLQGEVLILPPG